MELNDLDLEMMSAGATKGRKRTRKHTRKAEQNELTPSGGPYAQSFSHAVPSMSGPRTGAMMIPAAAPATAPRVSSSCPTCR